jgi:hypothetical protein
MKLTDLNLGEERFFIRVSMPLLDGYEDFGPITIFQIKNLLESERINGKSLIFRLGGDGWKLLCDYEDYEDFFGVLRPDIDGTEIRVLTRKDLNCVVEVIGDKNAFKAIDISMMAIRVIGLGDFEQGKAYTLKIDHPELDKTLFYGQVMRIIKDQVILRLVNMKEYQLNMLSKYVHSDLLNEPDKI